MNNEVKSVNPNGSLMRKTKKELIEIILRKDAVEVALRKDLEGACKTNESLMHHCENLDDTIDKRTYQIDTLQAELAELRKDYEEECDSNVQEYEEHRIKIKALVVALWIMTAIAGASTITLICERFIH